MRGDFIYHVTRRREVMTTQRPRAPGDSTNDDVENDEDDGDGDAAVISGWGNADFDAAIFTSAPAASSKEQQQHTRKNKKTLRLAEDPRSRSSPPASVKIPKAQLVTTQSATSKTPDANYNNNNHPSHHHHSNSKASSVSKTALGSREFAVSGYAAPTSLMQTHELSPTRRRDQRPPRTNHQQTQSKQPASGSLCKIVGLIDDDAQEELWRLPPAVHRSEAFRHHHHQQQRTHHEKTLHLPPLLQGSNSVDSLLSRVFRSDLEQKMKALPVSFGSHLIGQSSGAVGVTVAASSQLLPTTLVDTDISSLSNKTEQQQQHYSSMRRSHRERQSWQNNNNNSQQQHLSASKYKQEAHATQVRCVGDLMQFPSC